MSNDVNQTYRNATHENFKFLKSAKTIQEAYLRAIPVENEGYLLPVCAAHTNDQKLHGKLAEWGLAGTDEFSANFLSAAERALFLVVDNTGDIIGCVGLNTDGNDERLLEIDHVVRGLPGPNKGLFSKALNAIVEWARKTINVDGFYVQVPSDNPNAIKFFNKNCFLEVGRASLDGKPIIRMDYQRPNKVGNSLILTAGPSISAREAVYAYDAALNGWNSEWSKYLTKFEAAFAEYVGAKYALATSSCTGALQIALMALDIGPGDEVIVPDETWVATANAVRYVGAIPVFADIELDTWNIDSTSIESLITPKTKAIIAVHMYGHPARMSNILAVAKKYNLKVVEDAAPAIGAEWQGQRCGSFGDFAAFSFQGAKLLVTGEGGMLVTSDDALYAKAKKIWDQGRNPSKVFWIDENGVKFKMSNIQAALGLGQLERADELIEMKRRVFSWYKEGLSDINFLTLNQEVEGARSIYWMSSLFLDENSPVSRDELMKNLRFLNVDSRPVFPAISQYPIWPRKQTPQPTAMRVGLRAMNLPSGVCLTRDEVAYICKAIKTILEGRRG